MNEKCLLLKTKNNRMFLTPEKNLTCLIEYAKTFEAEIYVSKPEKGQKILELKALTVAICSSEYKNDPECKVLKKLFPKDEKKIGPEQIREFIQKTLLSGKALSLKELKVKYSKLRLTDACLCNHLSHVRKQLIKEGHSFRKISAGNYCLTTS